MIHFKTAFILINILFFGACNSLDSGNNEVSTIKDFNQDLIVVSDCSHMVGIEKIICLANTFATSLNDRQRAIALKEYSISDAKKWSNYPVDYYTKRVGLSFREMTPEQIGYAKALLVEISGTHKNEGWDELQQLINADEFLFENDKSNEYGAATYRIALLGYPTITGTFEIQFGGHHIAFANTYTNGVLVGATPSFRSAEPFLPFTYNGMLIQPMIQEKNDFSAMLKSLSNKELAVAKMSSTIRDIQAGPQRDNNFPSTPVGLKCSELNNNQKKLVLQAIGNYVYDINDEAAEELMKIYTDELDDTYIAFSGTTNMTTRNDYMRIDGPSVWIEYSCHSGYSFPDKTHPHSVWRDKIRDYGGNN